MRAKAVGKHPQAPARDFLNFGYLPVKNSAIREDQPVEGPPQDPSQGPPLTLGAVLYATAKPLVAEGDWAGLVKAVMGGDELALHALYARAHRVVFTLAVRITANRETAEEVTLDVFHDVWRKASSYDPDSGSVLAWIMNQARSRAIDRLRFESRKKRRCQNGVQPIGEAAADPEDVVHLKEQGRWLRGALASLTQEERQAIETSFLAGLSHADTAARLDVPLGTTKTRIRSGLHKLRREFTAQAVKP